MYEAKYGKKSKTSERTLETLLKGFKNKESVKSACKRFFSAAAGCEAKAWKGQIKFIIYLK